MDDDSRYEDALRRMAKLVNNLMSRGDCGPFREPVDWRDLGLWDYPKVIKKVRKGHDHLLYGLSL
jgi:hypothetical protein